MSDETKNDLPVESEDIVDEVIDTAIDLVSDQAVPTPIRKGFLAACKRLGTAMVEDFAGHFERKSTEKWAETNARVKIYEEVGDQISQKIKVDPEFPHRASYTFAKQILREQYNREQVLGMTAGVLKEKEYDNSENQQAGSDTEKTISEDWFNIFDKEASQKSSEDMQRRFAQALAGEIEKPGSYSIKAIKALGDMEQKVATLFNTFCSLCLVYLEDPEAFLKSPSNFKIRDARIPIIRNNLTDVATLKGRSDRDMNKLSQKSQSIYQQYGFGFNEFQLLSEHGLIQDETYSQYPHFWYDNEIYIPVNPSAITPPKAEDCQQIPVSGFRLSSVGRELFHITKRDNPPEYLEHLIDFLEEYYNLKMYKFPKKE